MANEPGMRFEDLTPEQQEKALACKSMKELTDLAMEEGFELTDEELVMVSGGGNWVCSEECSQACDFHCPLCDYDSSQCYCYPLGHD